MAGPGWTDVEMAEAMDNGTRTVEKAKRRRRLRARSWEGCLRRATCDLAASIPRIQRRAIAAPLSESPGVSVDHARDSTGTTQEQTQKGSLDRSRKS